MLFGLDFPVKAFWGATEEEKAFCRNSASGERNEWSAKQTYKYCLKNLGEEKKKIKREEKLQIQKAKKLKESCERKVKEFGLAKKLKAESEAFERFKSLSTEQKKTYLDIKYGRWGFERFYFERYAGKVLRWNNSYRNYIKDGCKELSIDGYKVKLDI